MKTYRLSPLLVAILLLTTLFAGLATVPAAAQTSATAGTTVNQSLAPTGSGTDTDAGGNLVSANVQASNAKHFIFRDDDIAPFASFGRLNALKAVNHVHTDKNVPVTLGIIAHPDPGFSGNELMADKETLSYLQSLATNPLFELAQHGYTHFDDTQSTVGASPSRMFGATPYQERLVGAGVYSEFRGRSYADQYNKIKWGRDDITEALGVTPTTFIPPWNIGDQNTLKAATALGFTLYSTGWEDFSTFDADMYGIHVQGAFFSIGWYTDSEWLTGMAQLTRDTDNVLNSASAGRNFMLFYHSWQFLDDNGSLDPLRISLFEQYIDHLKARRDVQFTTHNNEDVRGRTQVLLSGSNLSPAIGQPVTFTGTLSSWNPTNGQLTPITTSGKAINVWHTFEGVRYDDATTKTDANGKFTFTQSFSSAAARPYYATFPGDSSYLTSTSNLVTIDVHSGDQPTTLTLSPSTTTPNVGQPVTFIATLTSGGAPVSSKSVTIYHYLNNVRYTDTTKTTDANGQMTLTQSFSSAAARPYYATFAGDSTYQSSTSSVVTINVQTPTKSPAQLTLSPSTTTPNVGQPVTFIATLTSGGAPVSSKSVTIYHYLNNVRYTDTTKTTDANGQMTLTQSFSSAAARPYYATFAGDSTYQSSTSGPLTINVS